MGKKSAFGLLGTIVLAGVTVGIAKYLKDYAGVNFADGDQIDNVKKDSAEVKEAAKRTYFAIKEKGNVKEAASELSKAAGAVITDAAGIAKTAGTETAAAFKDLKSRYDEDPEAVRSELAGNISEMGQDIAKKAQETAGSIRDRFTGAADDLDIDEAFEDMEDAAKEAADEAQDAFREVAEEASEAGEAAAETVSDVVEEAAGAAEQAGEEAAEAAQEAVEAAEETAAAAAEACEGACDTAAEAAGAAADTAEAVEKAAAKVTEDFTATISDDEN